jgi:AraC-like DNA-binding protein
MIDNNITVIFRYIGLTQAVFAISYLLFFKKRTLTTLFFCLFFITFISPTLDHIIANTTLLKTFPRLFFLPTGFYFFAMPIYFLYVKSLFEKLRLKQILLYLLAGFIEFFIILYLFCSPNDYSFKIRESYSDYFAFFYGLFLPIFSLCFIFATLIRIKKYQNKFLDFFSNTQKINLNWIKFTSYILIINYLFQLLTFAFLFEKEQRDLVFLFDAVLSVLYVYWVSIFGIKQSHIPEDFTVFDNSKVSFSENKDDFSKIESFIILNKLYKNPNLTVVELSNLVGIHPKKISQSINHFAKMNFNSYINKYRIDEAQKLLSDKNYYNLTIDAIAKEAGFNSKSVFNTLFKIHTGKTPNQYKIASKS